jgi:hypothetical protein
MEQQAFYPNEKLVFSYGFVRELSENVCFSKQKSD